MDVDGGKVRMLTADLQQTLSALLDWANHHQIQLFDLIGRPGSLQEAFLAVAESGDNHTDPGRVTA